MLLKEQVRWVGELSIKCSNVEVLVDLTGKVLQRCGEDCRSMITGGQEIARDSDLENKVK